VTVHSETVRTERHGSVGVIIIDNPPVNAIAPSVRDGVAAATAELAEDARVAALVLHCAGGTFMAGADIKKLGAAPSRLTSEFSRDENDPAGLSHCAQLDSRRYAQDVRRHMLNFCAAACAARC
jgi:enoyl-CoA hydratase/carnithine racemase